MSENKRINDGGPAFPCEGGACSGLHAHPGMSLRDYLAAEAMKVVAEHPDMLGLSFGAIAAASYDLADEMIAASGKEDVNDEQ